MSRARVIAAALMFVLIVSAPPAPAASQSYTFTTIDSSLIRSTWSSGINNSGTVVGYYVMQPCYFGTCYYGFMESGDFYTGIDCPNAAYTFAMGINNKGRVIGYWWDSVQNHGFATHGGGFDDKDFNNNIDYPGANDTFPMTINDHGRIAGFYRGATAVHGFVGTPGNFKSIDFPKSTGTLIYGINNSGDLTGQYADGQNTWHGFLRKGGRFMKLDNPSAFETSPQGINNKGEITGYINTFATGIQGFVYSKGGWRTFEVPAARPGNTYANGINDNGQITGWYFDSRHDVHGFIATPVYSTSGTVKSDGRPLGGITITLSGTSSATTLTDPNGNYSFSGLAGGSYTITPSMTGHIFNPAKRKVDTANGDALSENFSATAVYSLSGAVSLGGAAFAGVNVTLGGPVQHKFTTGSDGNYKFENLLKGSYTITPSLAGYSFQPNSMKVLINRDLTEENFAAAALPTYSISGGVMLMSQRGRGPLSGVTVTLSGAAKGTTTTTGMDPNFLYFSAPYTFSGLYSGTYTLTPSLPGYTFEPAAATVRITNQDCEVDFTARKAETNIQNSYDSEITN